jgi:hypothetical protein
MIVIANRIETNRKTNSFLATQKPVVIIVKDKDSTYIAADTLFSGLRKYDTSLKKMATTIDTLRNKKIISANATKDLIKNRKKNEVLDTVKNTLSADTDEFAKTLENINPKDVTKIDSLKSKLNNEQNSESAILKDSTNNLYTKIDTVNNKQLYNKTPQDSIRYILGYNNVRIYNDSSQAVCDSMYYSSEDSVFRMFRNPIVWKEKNQIMGDTMYLFTEKQQPKRIYVFNNSIVVNQQNPAMYNQGGGRTLNAYFIGGKINYTRIKGSPAETIFYAQDGDSAYVGMNRSSGDVVDVYFEKEEVRKIKFINNVDGIMYPLNQIPSEKKYLRNFKWEDKRRPKNKLELFE